MYQYLTSSILLNAKGGKAVQVTVTGIGKDEEGPLAFVTLRHIKPPRTTLSWDYFVVRSVKKLKEWCDGHNFSFKVHPNAKKQMVEIKAATVSEMDTPPVQVPMPAEPLNGRPRDAKGSYVSMKIHKDKPDNLPMDPRPKAGPLDGVLDNVPELSQEEVEDALDKLNELFPLEGERLQMSLPI